MTTWLEPVSNAIGLPVWTLGAFVILLAALSIEAVYRVFISRLAKLAERSPVLWDDAVVYAGSKPISLLIWWQGVVMAARLASPHTQVLALSPELLAHTQQLGLVVAMTWFAFRLTTGFERAFLTLRERGNERIDLTTVQVIGRIVRIAVVLTGALTILSILDVPISGFLAAGGVGGIAVGLAARDLLANFFGGFMVFMDRPFSVGDWIRSPDRSIEGVVQKIGWRVTEIRKFDRRPMYVPNATFTTLTVENPSRMTHRRIFDHIGVRYDDQAVIRDLVDAIRRMIQSHPDIATEEIIMVHFDRFGPSSLDIMVYCFTRTTDWATYHGVREDVLLKIADIIAEHGAEVAFPTRTLHVPALSANTPPSDPLTGPSGD